jgi:hypothetical protein
LPLDRGLERIAERGRGVANLIDGFHARLHDLGAFRTKRAGSLIDGFDHAGAHVLRGLFRLALGGAGGIFQSSGYV